MWECWSVWFLYCEKCFLTCFMVESSRQVGAEERSEKSHEMVFSVSLPTSASVLLDWRGGGGVCDRERERGWGVFMCSDGRSPSCHRHPVASSPLIWEKNTWCHQRDADWIQMFLSRSFHVFNEGTGRVDFFIISFPSRFSFPAYKSILVPARAKKKEEEEKKTASPRLRLPVFSSRAPLLCSELHVKVACLSVVDGNIQTSLRGKRRPDWKWESRRKHFFKILHFHQKPSNFVSDIQASFKWFNRWQRWHRWRDKKAMSNQ